MKIELLGDVYTKDPFKGTCVTWTLWLNEEYEIASGRAASKVKAEQAGNAAFVKFKRALAHCKKHIRFVEFA